MIIINNYPQLKLIAWNRHNQLIEEVEALELYEVNWRFIDVKNLTTGELSLINELVKNYGNGVFFQN